MLEAVMKENDLLNMPQGVLNADESGIQPINKSGKVVAKKDAKDVHVLTPCERGGN
jgi:hypothetical protein